MVVFTDTTKLEWSRRHDPLAPSPSLRSFSPLRHCDPLEKQSLTVLVLRVFRVFRDFFQIFTITSMESDIDSHLAQRCPW